MPKKKEIKYTIDSNGCHICTSHFSDRYVQIWKNNKLQKMHRVVYSEFYMNGEQIDDKVVVRHKCDNSLCINPEHLELGTQKDNIHDMIKRKRFAVGENHGRSKLKNETVFNIFYEIGTNKSVGDKYGVSSATVSLIKNKRKWKHLLGDA